MLREAAARALNPPGPHPIDADRARVQAWFVRADGAALPFVDAFDAVLSTATFHWILDHDQLFSSIYRALAPGGRLVAQCGGGANLSRLLDRAESARRSTGTLADASTAGKGRGSLPTCPTTVDRLGRAGFTAIDVSIEPSAVTFPDRASFREFVSCVCLRDHLSRMPDTCRPDFLDTLSEQAATDDPPFTLDYWRLNIAATKPAGAEQAA